MDNTENNRALFARKLAKVKVEIGKMVQDKLTAVGTGGSVKVKYTSLDTIYQKLTPILTANSLVMTMENVIQMIGDETNHYVELNKDAKQINIFANRGYSYSIAVALIDTDTGFTQTYRYECLFDQPQSDIIKSYGSMMTYMQRYVCDMLFSLQSSERDPDDNIKAQTPIAKAPSKDIPQAEPMAVKHLTNKEYMNIYNDYKEILPADTMNKTAIDLGFTWKTIPVNRKNDLVTALNDAVIKLKGAE